jgi:glucose dehydrogenase
MNGADFRTVVVGAGFAGLSVAQALRDEDTAVIDRGEPLDPAEAAGTLKVVMRAPADNVYVPDIDAQLRSLRSGLIRNDVVMPLSTMSVNLYSYRQGGISNWWGGYAARLTDATFRRDGVLAWPVGLEVMRPHYEQAESLLHVHGDPLVDDYTMAAELPGWHHWRDYFAGLFPLARVTPQAKNVSGQHGGNSGLCLGNGQCAVCPNDAKARPSNVFPEVNVIGRALVEEIVFSGNRAVALRGQSDGEPFSISCDRVVVAAGGLENVALLRRSALPAGVPPYLGHFFQDHTTCEVLALMPRPLKYHHLGAEGAVEIPELSGELEGIEVKTVMLITPPSRDQLKLALGPTATGSTLLDLQRQMSRLARFYLQMEIPPEWELAVRTRGNEAYLYTLPYLQHLPTLDAVVLRVMDRMMKAGLQVKAVMPHHREKFGGHHYSGTTAMSRTPHAVVDTDQRLIGTDNVYINGGSVLPRCGGSGPTLTIVACGLRLGRHLALPIAINERADATVSTAPV